MKLKILPCLLACILSTGCAVREERAEIYAMDTLMTLKAYGSGAEAALSEAEAEIKRLDGLFRRGSADSEIFKINHGEPAASVDSLEIVKRAAALSRETGGAFEPTIAPVADLWGFYDENFRVPSRSEIDAALRCVGVENVEIGENEIFMKNGASLDLGGIAKGFASDRVMEIFEKNGVKSAVVSLGGNVQTLGEKPGGGKWRVAVQDPDSEGYVGFLNVSDMAVVTSGGYRRYFESGGKRYHHIIDPKTGFPSESGLKSVTVISSDAAAADALSTAFFVMGLDKSADYLKAHPGFDAVFVTEENEVYVTEGAEEMFESEKGYKVVA